MSRILCLSDTHIGAGYDHRRDALADTSAMFDQVAALVLDRRVDLVLHAGDVFHRAKPTPTELHVFKHFCGALERAGIPMIALGGNGMHEAAPGQKSALELFASVLVHVSRSPEVIVRGGVAVCTLPPLATKGEDAIDELLASARALYAEALPNMPRVLLAHQMVSGASLPTGLSVEQIGSTVLPLWALEELGYDAIVLGDIHKAQELAVDSSNWDGYTEPWIGYCGSPQINDFGEENNTPGVWLLDLDTIGTLHAPPEFITLADRRFVTIDADFGDFEYAVSDLDETDWLAAAIAERFPLVDAVIRVRYRATEEQHRRVDQRAITQLLEDAGIHNLYGGLSWEPVRENRARVASMDESLEPLAALALWLDANDVAESERESVTQLLTGWLA